MSVELDEGYVRCIVEMAEAALRWLREHGAEGVRFSLPPPDWMVIVPLPVAVAMVAESEASRELLLAMDRAVDGKGTLFQASIVVRELGLPHEWWSESKLAALLTRGKGVS